MQARQRRAALRVEDRLRRLDHDLDAQRARREPEPVLEHVEQRRRASSTCSASVIFGSVTTKFVGQLAARRVEQLGEEDVERAQRARARARRVSGLMRMPMNGGSDAGRHARARPAARRRPRGRPPRRRGGCRSRPRSRCGSPRPARAELLAHALVDLARASSPRMPIASASVAASGAYSSSARSASSPSFFGGVGGEQVRAAVDGVHGWRAPESPG